MKENKNISTGVTYGLVIGLLYILMLFGLWNTATNMIKFSLYSLLSFVVILGLLFYEAYQRRKMNDGYIDLKSLFQTLFVSILIIQLLSSIYTYVHLTYIDPTVGDRMMAGVEEMMDKMGDKISDSDREKTMEKMGEIKQMTDVPQMIKSYLSSVAIMGIFALIIAAIVKKKKPVFEEIN